MLASINLYFAAISPTEVTEEGVSLEPQGMAAKQLKANYIIAQNHKASE